MLNSNKSVVFFSHRPLLGKKRKWHFITVTTDSSCVPFHWRTTPIVQSCAWKDSDSFPGEFVGVWVKQSDQTEKTNVEIDLVEFTQWRLCWARLPSPVSGWTAYTDTSVVVGRGGFSPIKPLVSTDQRAPNQQGPMNEHRAGAEGLHVKYWATSEIPLAQWWSDRSTGQAVVSHVLPAGTQRDFVPWPHAGGKSPIWHRVSKEETTYMNPSLSSKSETAHFFCPAREDVVI